MIVSYPEGTTQKALRWTFRRKALDDGYVIVWANYWQHQEWRNGGWVLGRTERYVDYGI